MAVYGVIADVHGNREALRVALEYLEAEAVDRLVCLGDIVGYNADANECVNMVMRRHVECIAGNHDLIAIGLACTAADPARSHRAES
jgi:predicted phosphodiesterase